MACANASGVASTCVTPLSVSFQTVGGIYGGTVSRCEQKTISGFPQDSIRFSVPSPTSYLETEHFAVGSDPARNPAKSLSFDEVESMPSICINRFKSRFISPKSSKLTNVFIIFEEARG